METIAAEITAIMNLITAEITVVEWSIAERSSATEDAVFTVQVDTVSAGEITERTIAAT
jgi:hypothetical protein